MCVEEVFIVCCVSGTVLGTREKAVNKTKSPYLGGLQFSEETDKQMKYTKKQVVINAM